MNMQLKTSEFVFANKENTISVNQDFVMLFLVNIAEEKQLKDIKDIISWTDDFATGWWFDCLEKTCHQLKQEKIYSDVKNMDWESIDSFGAFLADSCQSYIANNHIAFSDLSSKMA